MRNHPQLSADHVTELNCTLVPNRKRVLLAVPILIYAFIGQIYSEEILEHFLRTIPEIYPTTRVESRLSEDNSEGEISREQEQTKYIENHLYESPKAWIVQGDTKPLNPFGVKLQNASHLELMSVMNLLYAKKHGYGYTRYQYEGFDGCAHEIYGARHPAWCKILAVFEILQNRNAALRIPSSVQYVVWIDSDAMMQHQHLSLPEIIATVPSGCGPWSFCDTERCRIHRESAAVLTTPNIPFCGESCLTAFQIWNRNATTRDDYLQILQTWWNSNQCANEFPWEQRAFNKDVYPKFALPSKMVDNQTEGRSDDDLRGGIAILNADVNQPKLPETELRKLFLRHIGHFNRKNDRLLHSQLVASYLNITENTYRSLYQSLLSDHVQAFTKTQMQELAKSLSSVLTNSTIPSPQACEYVVQAVINPT